jgi:hypothetical protein
MNVIQHRTSQTNAPPPDRDPYPHRPARPPRRSRRRLPAQQASVAGANGYRLAVAGALVLGLVAVSTPAQAQYIDDTPGGSSVTRSHYDRPLGKICRMKVHAQRRHCKSIIRIHAGKMHRVTQKMAIAAGPDVRDSDGRTLLEAVDSPAKAGAWKHVWTRTWSQQAFAFHWWQLPSIQLYNSHQSGQAYFDGEDVWMSSHRGTDPGYHVCSGDRSVLVEVTITNCYEQWATDGSGNEFARMIDDFRANALIDHVPIWNNEEIHTNVHADGYLSFWYLNHRVHSGGDK